MYTTCLRSRETLAKLLKEQRKNKNRYILFIERLYFCREIMVVMKNRFYKVVKYFLYSMLMVLISKFIFYIPIFYRLNSDNFTQMIQCEKVDVISLVVFFLLLLLFEKKKKDSYGFYALFYGCFHFIGTMIFTIYQYVEFSLSTRVEGFEYHFWNEFLSYKEEMLNLFFNRFFDVGIISVYIVSSFFIVKKYVTK